VGNGRQEAALGAAGLGQHLVELLFLLQPPPLQGVGQLVGEALQHAQVVVAQRLAIHALKYLQLGQLLLADLAGHAVDRLHRHGQPFGRGLHAAGKLTLPITPDVQAQTAQVQAPRQRFQHVIEFAAEVGRNGRLGAQVVEDLVRRSCSAASIAWRRCSA